MRIQFGDRLPKVLEGCIVVELSGDEADALGQLSPDVLIKGGARVLLDSVVHDPLEILVLPIATSKTDKREPGRQQSPIGEVVHRRHQLLAGQVSRDPEDDETARPGDAIESAVGRQPQGVEVRRYLDWWHQSSAARMAAMPLEGSAMVRLRTGRPRSPSTLASPSACARISCPNVNGRSGISRSASAWSRSCKKAPFLGPPLWT